MNRTIFLGGTLVTLLGLIFIGNLRQGDGDVPKVVQKVEALPHAETQVIAEAPKEILPTKDERFASLVELSKTGPLTPELAEGLRLTGGKKAIEPILSVMRSTSDWKVVGACAVQLQNYHDPKLMHDVLSRLDELGYLDKAATLPWISKTLFTKYMETAPDVSLAVRAIQTRPSLGGEMAKVQEPVK